MKKLIYFLLFLATPAFAQVSGGVQQYGPVISGNCSEWFGNEMIEDTGSPCGNGGSNATLTATTSNLNFTPTLSATTTTGGITALFSGALYYNPSTETLGGLSALSVTTTTAAVPTTGLYSATAGALSLVTTGASALTISSTGTVALPNGTAGAVLCLTSSNLIGHCASGASCTGTCTCVCTVN